MTTLPGAVNPCDFLYKLASQRSMPPPTFEQVNHVGKSEFWIEQGWNKMYHTARNEEMIIMN